MVEHKNISIVWDFDKTLTRKDSTTELIKLFLSKPDREDLWKDVKAYSGVDSKEPMDSISTSKPGAYRLQKDMKLILSNFL